jgi:hypothetical protein
VMISMSGETTKANIKGKNMMINEALSAWFEPWSRDRRFRMCEAVRIYKCTIFSIALIAVSLLTTGNSTYAQGGGGPGSYTAPRPTTGNGDFKALKVMAHLWHLWMKGPKATLIAPRVAPIAPTVPKRSAKKAPENKADTRLTALPVPTPVTVAKLTTLAVPAVTPATEGAEIQVFWWPVPDATATNSKVTR